MQWNTYETFHCGELLMKDSDQVPADLVVSLEAEISDLKGWLKHYEQATPYAGLIKELAHLQRQLVMDTESITRLQDACLKLEAENAKLKQEIERLEKQRLSID